MTVPAAQPAKLTGNVGRGQANNTSDVKSVQLLLGKHREWLGNVDVPAATGIFDETTRRAIKVFQGNGASLIPPFQDAEVTTAGFTAQRLQSTKINAPRHRYFQSSCWYHQDPDFTAEVYAAAAATLACEPAAIEAVAENETKRSPWDSEGRPLILFERHIFGTLTVHRFDKEHPDIASRTPTPAGRYGSSSAQPRRLWRAAMLDEPAALKSASWGTFQILGSNHARAGYASVEAFVDGMMQSRQRHLDAFVSFIRSDHRLLHAIQKHDWETLARLYNGPTYKTHDYDGRLQRSYDEAVKRLAAQATPQGIRS